MSSFILVKNGIRLFRVRRLSKPYPRCKTKAVYSNEREIQRPQSLLCEVLVFWMGFQQTWSLEILLGFHGRPTGPNKIFSD